MKYFTEKEFTSSSVAEKLGIDNSIPNQEFRYNMQCLVDKILDPCREMLGEPIYISSGFRTKELNRIVGGVPNSFHTIACASDIYTIHMDKMIEILKTLPYTELIIYKNRGFVHVAYVSGRKEHELIYK